MTLKINSLAPDFTAGGGRAGGGFVRYSNSCLLYTSDSADEGLGVDLGGRRIIKKT